MINEHRPRALDARIAPVISLLREKAAERSSHPMSVLERECRMRNIDAGLLDEAVHHLGGRLSRNGGTCCMPNGRRGRKERPRGRDPARPKVP